MTRARDKIVPVLVILAGLVVVWYVAAVLLNAPFQRDLDRRAGETPGTIEFIGKTLSQPKPTMPAPHQVAQNFFENTFLRKITSNRSLVYHAWVTLSSTLLGFAFGTALGVLIAVGIVHFTSLDRSLMPWIIASQTIPILAIAPMVIVVFAAIGVTGIIPKSLISTYLSFFPVAVGMVKGLRSPELTHLDLMHTYNASASQIFWKLRVPASVPFLFTSMKVAVAASLVGAIVAELPTGAVAGIGAKLLSASYYSQTIDMWSALVAGSIVAALLVTLVGAGRPPRRPLDGGEAGMSRFRPSWQARARAGSGGACGAAGADEPAGSRGAGQPDGDDRLSLSRHARPYRRLAGPGGPDFAVQPASTWPRPRCSSPPRILPPGCCLSGIAGFEGTALAPYFLLARGGLAARLALRDHAVRAEAARVRGGEHGARPAHPGHLRRLDPHHLGSGRRAAPASPSSCCRRHRRSARASPTRSRSSRPTSTRPSSRPSCSAMSSAAARASLRRSSPTAFDFLRRGLLPIGNMVSALPIIGVAPIMVMWFGFDWQSKAAVVIVMTFFPMLVNTVTGLAASGHMERDLMRTYASDYWQTLFKLGFPPPRPSSSTR